MESHSGINSRRSGFFDANFEQVMIINWLIVIGNDLATKIYPGLSSEVLTIVNFRHLQDVSMIWTCAKCDLRF